MDIHRFFMRTLYVCIYENMYMYCNAYLLSLLLYMCMSELYMYMFTYAAYWPFTGDLIFAHPYPIWLGWTSAF